MVPLPVGIRRMLLIRRVAVCYAGAGAGSCCFPGLRRHKRCRDDVDAGIQLRFDLLAGEVFAVGVVIGQIERAADITLSCAFRHSLVAAVVTEHGVKAAEAWLYRGAGRQSSTRLPEPAA